MSSVPRGSLPTPKPSWTLDSALTLTLRLIVGGLLLYAGFSKAVGPSAEFAAAIDAYRILPTSLATPLAQGLPWIEMWVGIFLFAGLFATEAALAATALFVVFIGALGSSLLRHLDLVSCGCFGQDSLSPHQTIFIDVMMLIASIWLATRKASSQRLSLENL